MRSATIACGALSLIVGTSAFVPTLPKNNGVPPMNRVRASSPPLGRTLRQGSALFYREEYDFYEVLGVPRDATRAEIKSAFRWKAKQFHPDASHADTVEQFHDVHRAYEVLNDPFLKQQYDSLGQNDSSRSTIGYVYNEDFGRRTANADAAGCGFGERPVGSPFDPGFGEYPADDSYDYTDFEKQASDAYHAGVDAGFARDTVGACDGAEFEERPVGSPFDAGFGQHYTTDSYDPAADFEQDTVGAYAPSFGQHIDLGDSSESFFGGMRNGSQARRRGPNVGQDVHYDLEIDFKTSVFGGEETIFIQHLETCNTCSGSGVKASTCSCCNGHGVIFEMKRSMHGSVQSDTMCPDCRGSGQHVEATCHHCQGHGHQSKVKRVKVEIPAGVLDFTKLKVRGEGDAGPNGGPAGDLYVSLSIKPDPKAQREGSEIRSETDIDIIDALLGASIKCPVVDGEVTIEVQPGTQPNEVIRLKGSGAPRLGRPDGRGDHCVKMNVEIPTHLSYEEYEIFTQLKAIQDFKKLRP